MTPKHIAMIAHAKEVAHLQHELNFYKDMVNKSLLERQRGLSGSGLKSLSLDKAIIHVTRQVDRLHNALKQSEEYHDSGHPEEFENYQKLADWYELANRQLDALKKSQRKRINIFEFSYELMDAIKEQTSIVDMLDELKIRKRRSGGNRYVVICPFHDESTPSCMIYVDDDKFHCFGCQANGDLIDFYQKYNDIEFDEALSRLCDALGIQVMDADQVEAVDSKLEDYKRRVDEIEHELATVKSRFAIQLQTRQGA